MSATLLDGQKLFGLLELDTSGMVLYSRIERGDDTDNPAPDVTGHNFYTEVAPFRNVEEFQRCLEIFRMGHQPAHSIEFTCLYDDCALPVKVLLARVRESTAHNLTKSILVHIRKTQ